MTKVFLARGDLSDRRESHAATEALVRRISEKLGVSPGKVLYLENGKPVFARGDWYVSVSHTGGEIFAAVSPVPVGLDVEKRRPVPKNVARRWFSEEERAMDFFEVWTAKEAVAKWNGAGLAGLRRVNVTAEGAFWDGQPLCLWREEQNGLVLTMAAAEPIAAEWIK